MWFIVTKEEQKRDREEVERIWSEWRERAGEKQKARESHEAKRCPHCGRNDPLPPWLL